MNSNRNYHNYLQLIDKLTHMRKIIVNRGTHPSLHENCQRQTTFAKAKLRVEYLTPYKRHVWNYAKANVNGINKVISQFNWQGFFHQCINK